MVRSTSFESGFLKTSKTKDQKRSKKSMHAIKDRVSEKLSRFFSDSPSSHTRSQESQATPFAKDGNSLSSILSFILPSANFESLIPKAQNNEARLIESLSFKWRSKSFSFKDKPLDRYADSDHEYDSRENTKSQDKNDEHGSFQLPKSNHKSSNNHMKNGELGAGTSASSNSNIFEDTATPYNLEKSMFFESSLPNIVKGCQWILMYSTARHGISLRTLIRKSADLTGPCLLITGDKQGAVFGGLLDCPLKPTAKKKYQGTNQSFVFNTLYGEPRLFRPTGANRYFYLCLNDLLALGGGTNFALCLNEDLLSGTSGPCETFGNLCLANYQDFEIKNVELWGFCTLIPLHELKQELTFYLVIGVLGGPILSFFIVFRKV